ncbi:hypothetical protein TWF679_008195 [Orbilia oligospora]|uniref:Nucleoside phosphorylase domain-containing protein n=1 Tax=Orbilia oligospora TaxID=2813651 RepID=A0A8H8V5W3_ORBOL|nr:hypothetical protein TWF679_008195 [Orbilia oligospora]
MLEREGEPNGQRDTTGAKSGENPSNLVAFSYSDYTVGWVCALPKEQTAATAMLDEIHSDLPKPPEDDNIYTLGVVSKHKVVIACLPKGTYGTNAAARVATAMVRTFPSIKFGLMVGIGGGNPVNDVRLGDVVSFNGILGEEGGGFKRIGSLNNPPSALRAALGKLESSHEMNGTKIPEYLDDLAQRWPRLVSKYIKSDSHVDPLLLPLNDKKPQSSENSIWLVIFLLLHKAVVGLFYWLSGRGVVGTPEEGATAKGVHGNHSQLQVREMRVHYGLIASGNSVIKSAEHRDMLNEKFGGKLLCVEMEAAGLMNDFPCLVIRGICDYADSSKNDVWQEHAAAVAAAFAKEFLSVVPVLEVDAMPTLGKIEHQLEEVSKCVNGLRSAQLCQEDQEILNWLTPNDYSLQQNDICRNKRAGTGQWLLNSAKYQYWLATEKQTLFCPGIPGAGKTVLISTVIGDLYNRFREKSDVGIAYIYCSFSQAGTKGQRVDQLLSNIIKQLSQNWGALPEVIKKLRKKHEKERSEPSLAELSETLQSIVALYARVFIAIDALDECGGMSWARLLEEMFDLQTKHSINLITTSRFIPEIIKKFETFPSLEIRASNDDIENYLGGCFDGSQMELEFSSVILSNQNLREEIKRVITDFADGMFLLAQLYVRTFEGKMTVKEVKIALKEIQERQQVSTEVGKLKLLEEAYDKTMERIKKKTEFSEVAKNALQWIVYSRRPLTVLELQHALGIEIGKDEMDHENIPNIEDVVSVCAGLVVVDKERNIIRLVHYTTQEYFKQSKGHGFPDAETYIAKACIGYLSYRSFESGWCQSRDKYRKRLERNPLYDYTARNWGYHMQKSSGLDSRVIEFLEDGAKIQSSAQAMMSTDTSWTNLEYTAFYEPGESLTGLKGLHLAVFFGLENATSEMILRAHNLNLTDGLRRTPLSWAAGNGQTAIGELLVKSGAEVDFSDIDGRTPLFWAAAGGHLSMIELLIRNGANVNATDIFGVTALHIAARRSYLRVISFLLDNGADGDMRDICGGTSLAWAISTENNAATRLLLGTCTNLDSEFDPTTRRQKEFYYDMPCSGYDDSTPQDRGIFGKLDLDNTECLLRRAVVNGDETVVRILMVKGSRPDLEYQKGLTPLSEAVKRRNQSIFELLVVGFKGTWAKIDLKNKFGRSYLSIAAEDGSEIIVELLLKMGINVESKDETGLTPLCRAAKEGHGKIVRVLLTQPGIEPDVVVRGSGSRFQSRGDKEGVDHRGRTPLSYAAEGGYADVVKLLLETGRVDPDPVRPRAGRTPLSYAAAGGHLAVVELLLGTGRVDPDSMYMASGASRIRAPLSYGSEYLYNPIPSITDRTPLSYAAEHGHVDVVEFLLGREGVDPDFAALSTGQTPLSYAAENGHIGVVDLLLATGRVNPDSRATSFHFAGRTPLSFASEKGYEAVVQCLLSRNADPYSRSKPYINTYRYWDPELVNGGRTPISYATTPGNEIILKLLLEKAKAEASLEVDSGRGSLYSADGQKATAAVIGPSRLARGANRGKGFSDDERGSRAGDLWEDEVYFRLEQCVKLDSELRGFTRAYEGREMRQVLERLVDTDLGDGIKQALLYCACRWGHEGIVEKLLDGGLGANFEIRLGRVESYRFTAGLFSDVEPSSWRGPPSYWRTPLLYAAEGGYEHIVGRLLKAGAEANVEDNDGLTPLSYAVKGGHEAVVRLLLDVHKTSGSLYDLKGKTPLTYAAKRGNVVIMKLLLERGFDPDPGDPEFDDKTPLASAVKNGHGEVVKLLLEDSRVNRNKVSGREKRTPLSYAAEKGYTKILEMLLDSDTIDPESRSKRRSALFWAVDNGHEKIVKALLASGADYSTTSPHRLFEDTTVLSLAALNGDVPVVKLLLENGADPNIQSKNGDTALSIAVDWGSEEQYTLVKLLLDSGADPNSVSGSRTVLALAALQGTEPTINLLLDRGADPNYASCGKTALASAASRFNGAEAVVKLLLDRGADPNSVSKDGRAALVSAVSTAYEAELVIKLLLDRGADPNYVSEDGTTALELAVTTGAESVVKLLLDGGANPNSISSDGSTVLALAGSRGFDSIVGLLLDRNADPETKSRDGSTALSRAIQFRHKSTANLLRAAMQLDLESEDSDTESDTESDMESEVDRDTESDSGGPEISGSNVEVEWLDIFDI